MTTAFVGDDAATVLAKIFRVRARAHTNLEWWDPDPSIDVVGVGHMVPWQLLPEFYCGS